MSFVLATNCHRTLFSTRCRSVAVYVSAGRDRKREMISVTFLAAAAKTCNAAFFQWDGSCKACWPLQLQRLEVNCLFQSGDIPWFS